MRFCAAVFVLSTFAFWVWAFSPWARRENPTRLDDRVFAAWADERCSQSQAAIEALPSPRQVQSPQQRAEYIGEGSDEIEGLLADLRSAAARDPVEPDARGGAAGCRAR